MAAGTTIWTAARDAGIDIPVLCHDERMDPVGVCRMCVVDVGGRVLAASCVRPCEDGMAVTTTSEDIERSRATLTELLLADQPRAARTTRSRRRPVTTCCSRSPTATASRPASCRAGLGRGTDVVQPGHRGRPRLLHPLRPLRARLRRPAGQRRHRPQRQGLRDADLVRPRRPDGRVVLRDVRGVRGRLPHRRADQQADPRRADPAAHRARRRSTASAPTAASAARSPTTSTGNAARSRSPRAATSPGRRAGCASRAATAGTTPPRRSG